MHVSLSSEIWQKLVVIIVLNGFFMRLLSGREQDFCMMCVMQSHIVQALSNTGNVIKPTGVINDLRRKYILCFSCAKNNPYCDFVSLGIKRGHLHLLFIIISCIIVISRPVIAMSKQGPVYIITFTELYHFCNFCRYCKTFPFGESRRRSWISSLYCRWNAKILPQWLHQVSHYKLSPSINA